MIIRRLSWRDLAPDFAETLNRFSLYASPSFVSLFETLGGAGGYYLVEDDGQTVAALPVVEFGRGPFRRLQALTDGLFASIWIHESAKARVAELSTALLDHIAGRSYLRASITDFDNQFCPRDWRSVEITTSLVDLNAADPAETWLPPDRKLRSEIAQAKRDGVAAIPFNGAVHLSSFLSLMRRTESRHGRRPKYPESFWRALAELSGCDPRIMWLCVESEGRMAASQIYFIDRETGLNWQIYFDKSLSRLKANQAIMGVAANRLRQAGIGYLNLGVTPPGASGVEAYKGKWGGRSYRYRIWKRSSFLGRWI